MSRKWVVSALALGVAGLGLAAVTQTAVSAQSQGVNFQALADQMAIQDMMVRFYGHLGEGQEDAFRDYFLADAVFEVNGRTWSGIEEIVALYGGLGGDREAPQGPSGVSHMLLTNPLIEVEGDTAYASFIWTGVSNRDALAAPVVHEQGREYTRFVRRNGDWRIQKRVIIADGGAPQGMMDTWAVKADYDIRTAP